MERAIGTSGTLALARDYGDALADDGDGVWDLWEFCK